MINFGVIYLHNLAKRVATGGPVHPAEIIKSPKIIDKVYGDGNGTLDSSDLNDIVFNVVDEVVDKAELVWEAITSIF